MIIKYTCPYCGNERMVKEKDKIAEMFLGGIGLLIGGALLALLNGVFILLSLVGVGAMGLSIILLILRGLIQLWRGRLVSFICPVCKGQLYINGNELEGYRI